jgi:hypothetical protein
MYVYTTYTRRPLLWSSGQSFWLQIQMSRVRFPVLPDFVTILVKVTLRLTVSQSISLAVEPHLGLMTKYLLLFDSHGLVFVGLRLWRKDCSVFCMCCWPSQCLSRVRVPWDSWPYFTVSDLRLPFSSPPTTRRITVEVFEPASTRVDYSSKSKLLYDWRFTANQFVFSSTPLRLTTRIFSPQLSPLDISPYVTSSLTRRWVCLLWICLAFRQVYISHI